MSAAATHFGLLDRVGSKEGKLSDGLAVCNLKHRRRVGALCMFYKICCNPNHALEAALPQVHVPSMMTRLAVSVHSRYLAVPRCRTMQFGRLRLFLRVCSCGIPWMSPALLVME